MAVPVAPPGTAEELAEAADEVVVLEEPEAFFAIGQFYANFSQTSDEEVAACLAGAALPIATGVGTADPPAKPVEIDLPEVRLAGDLTFPPDPIGIVVFAHGSGSSRLSPRNTFVAAALRRAGICDAPLRPAHPPRRRGPRPRLRRRHSSPAGSSSRR